MKNILLIITMLFCGLVVSAQLTVDTSNGNVGVKESTPEEALVVSGNLSIDNFGTRYLLFNNKYSGTFSNSIDKNGIRWQTPGQTGMGLDSLRYYLLYNYGQNKLFFDNNDDYTDGVAMSIEQLGNVGIGTDAPLNTLQVDGSALINSSIGFLKIGFPTSSGYGFATTGAGSTLLLNSYTNTSTQAGSTTVMSMSAGNMGLGVSSASEKLEVNGNIAVAGEIVGVSDRKIKKNITTIDSGLDMILDMNPVSYTFRQDEYPAMNLGDGIQFGLIAQEIEEIAPNMVNNNVKTTNAAGEEVGIKSINYIEIIPVLVSAVQELEVELQEKEAEIAELKKQQESVAQMSARIDRLESLLSEVETNTDVSKAAKK